MEEKLVSYELAKLAKEKCFDGVCKRYYTEKHKNKNVFYSQFKLNNKKKYYLAPTQSLLQKWLRDKHDIHVFIIPCVPYSFSKYKDMDVIWIYDIYKPLLVEYGCSDKIEFVSYEDALDACLYECLGLINKN